MSCRVQSGLLLVLASASPPFAGRAVARDIPRIASCADGVLTVTITENGDAIAANLGTL